MAAVFATFKSSRTQNQGVSASFMGRSGAQCLISENPFLVQEYTRWVCISLLFHAHARRVVQHKEEIAQIERNLPQPYRMRSSKLPVHVFSSFLPPNNSLRARCQRRTKPPTQHRCPLFETLLFRNAHNLEVKRLHTTTGS